MEILSKLHSIADVRKALHSLPKGLDATYERILLSIPEEHQMRARKALLLLSGPRWENFSNPYALAEAIMVDINDLTYEPKDRILLPEEFLGQLCTCLVTLDETHPQQPLLRLAHYTVKEYLYSDRIKESEVAYYHCCSEYAAFTGCMTHVVYLLNLSYKGVPSPEEFLMADASRQGEYYAAVMASYPLLETAIYYLTHYLPDVEDSQLQRKIDTLIAKLFSSGKPHYRWFEWRAVISTGWMYPLWTNFEGMESNVALTLANFFEMPGVMEIILQGNPGIERDRRELTLNPMYAKEWAEVMRGDKISDIQENPQDYLPRGSYLEAVIHFPDSIACLDILAERTTDFQNFTGSSGLSLLSTAVKAYFSEYDSDRHQIFDFLLEAGAEVNPFPVSETPLQSAAKRLDSYAISQLLAAGALVNQVADDVAIISNINSNFTGTPEEKNKAIWKRGFGKSYKTPLCLVLEELGDDDSREAEEILRTHGGLSLHLFPVKSLPGYCSQDWKLLEEAGWHGSRDIPTSHTQ
jgi:hypothetical protein